MKKVHLICVALALTTYLSQNNAFSDCVPVTIESVAPGLIYADGADKPITIKGDGFNDSMQVIVDQLPVPITILNANEAVTVLNYSEPGYHEINIQASCSPDLLDPYIITVEAPESVESLMEMSTTVGDSLDSEAALAPGTCTAPISITFFSYDTTGNWLCWNSKRVRLIGYSAFEEITWDHHYCEPNCGNFAPIPKYMQAVRYFPSAPQTHGVNLQRIMAFGANNILNAETGVDPETMPFTKLGTGKYDVKDNTALDTVVYLPRLVTVLDNAQKNGQAVELTLFPGSQMTGYNGTALQDNYALTPWFPTNNNMYSNSVENCPVSAGGLPNNQQDPFPEFYYICNTGNGNTNVCADADLNCLGRIQQNFVYNIVDKVRHGNTNSTSFKNVFFEIMNEAPMPTGTDLTRYVKWHHTVANWIRYGHQYFVSANPIHGTYTDLTACCQGCTGDGCPCSIATCTNGNQVFLMDNINIATLHCSAWNGSGQTGCNAAKQATWRFQKPVIIDDDGCVTARNTNCTVQDWAKDATACAGFGVGRTHFNHLDEMKFMPDDTTVCNRTAEGTGTNRKLDCNALNQLADAVPSDLCGAGFGLSCVCATDSGYCFNATPPCGGPGKCDSNVQGCPP